MSNNTVHDAVRSYSNQEYTTALQLFEKSLDSYVSYGYLAELHLNLKGQGVSEDYAEALAYAFKGMEEGDDRSCLSLGHMYKFGLGVTQSYEKAEEYYQMAAQSDTPSVMIDGCYELGLLHYNGINQKKDFEEALFYFKEGFHASHTPSLIKIAELSSLYHYELEESLMNTLRKKLDQNVTESNDALASYGIGYLYEMGFNCKKDYVAANRYYFEAVKKQNTQAMLAIVNLAFQLNDDTHYLKTANSLKAAFRRNDPYALTAYGMVQLYNPESSEKEMKSALGCLVLGAEKGVRMAIDELATFYLNDADNYKKYNDYAKAVEYLKLSIEYGSDAARCKLGDLYREGRKVNIDYEKACGYYQEASEHQWPESYYKLALLYEYGIGLTRDLDQASLYYEIAAKHNYLDAQNKVDLLEKKWYRKWKDTVHKLSNLFKK